MSINSNNFELNNIYKPPQAFGIGIATTDSKGNLLDTYFPTISFKSNYDTASALAKILKYKNGTQSFHLNYTQLTEILNYFETLGNEKNNNLNFEVIKTFKNTLQQSKEIEKVIVVTFIAANDDDTGVIDVSDAYLRLHLLSHRFIKPNNINLNGLFKVLPNNAWTSEGAISLNDLPIRKIKANLAGRNIIVYSIDKFPRMTDYVTPHGIRIADTSRVRLGAYLGEGTTIMHEGFVNFNAGCEGPNMIEGRISAGVFVKKGSDLGGGCSTMGTLSGGGNIVISIGENCLLGANSGLGIPLGNRCTIEAGLYLTAGSKILFEGKLLKAKEFSGKNDLLFRRNSQTGQIEALSKSNSVELNKILHSN